MSTPNLFENRSKKALTALLGVAALAIGFGQPAMAKTITVELPENATYSECYVSMIYGGNCSGILCSFSGATLWGKTRFGAKTIKSDRTSDDPVQAALDLYDLALELQKQGICQSVKTPDYR